VQREVKVEMLLMPGSTWASGATDVSAYTKLGNGVSISRGRDSETDDPISVGTVTLTLANSDGRFSPEYSGSPYYPNVAPNVPIRLSVKVGATWYVRGYGTVQSWGSSALSWMVATCAITANDGMGAFPDYTLRQASDETVKALADPVHYWPLRDSEAPVAPAVGSVQMTANAGSGWGAGGLLAMDEGDQQHPLFNSASGGLTLTSGALNVKPPYRICLVVMDDPGKNCTILSGLPGGYSIRWWDGNLNTQGFGLYPLHTDGSGWTGLDFPCVVSLTVTATKVTLEQYDSTGYQIGGPQTLSLGTLRSLVLNPTLSGGAAWGAGHLFVMRAVNDYLAQDVPLLAPDGLPSRLLGSRVPGAIMADVVKQLLTFARSSRTISGVPSGAISMPALEGRDLGDAVAAVAKGMGARMVDALDGTLTWVPFMSPSAPIALPAGAGAPDWGSDLSAWLSDCTVTWMDGTTSTRTRPDGPRRSDTIEGVHATRSADRSFIEWLVWSPTRARMPEVSYNLSSLSDAAAATLMGVTIGARVSLSTLPAWVPSPQICIVEGVEESIDNDEWSLTLKLSPDVYSRVFILDDAIQGVLDSAYLLAP